MDINTFYKQSYPSFTKNLYQLPAIIQTVDGNSLTVTTIPLPPGKAMRIVADIFCCDASVSNVAGGRTEGMFYRPVAGNVTRTNAGVAAGLISNILGTFVSPQPSVDLSPNTTSQGIDVNITGKLSATINWFIELTVYQNT